MIVDLFFHHVKNCSQHLVGRRHSRNLLASSSEHSQVVLTAGSFTCSRMHQVCLGWDKNTSWPAFCASSTIHHHEPIASSAILLAFGSFFKARSTVTTLLAKRNCEGDLLSLNTANCDTSCVDRYRQTVSWNVLLLAFVPACLSQRVTRRPFRL